MSLGFNYSATQFLTNPVLIGNNASPAGGSVDSLPNLTQFRAGQVTQSGTTITGSGTTFTAADVGATLTWADGTTETISAFGSATSVTGSLNVTKAVPQNFSMSNGGNLPACFALDIKSNQSTLLVPRMTTTQRNALPVTGTSLPNGSIVYDITVGALFSYTSHGWNQLGTTGGGQFLAASGTGPLPTYSFSADPTTGMWLATPGHLDFSANGVNSFEVTSQGNAVNLLQVVSNATGVSPDLIANGTLGVADANMNLGLVAQGSGSVIIYGTETHTGGVSTNGSLGLSNAADSQFVFFTPYELDNSYTEVYVVKQLTQANIQAAFATPIPLTGVYANQSIIVTQCEMYMHFDTTAFSGAGTGIIQYGNTIHGGGTNALGTAISNAFLTTTASGYQAVAPLTAANTAATITTGAALYFSNTSGAFTLGGANALLTIYLKFIVIPTA